MAIVAIRGERGSYNLYDKFLNSTADCSYPG